MMLAAACTYQQTVATSPMMLAAACTFMLSLLARTIAAGTNNVDVRLMLHPNENVAGSTCGILTGRNYVYTE